MNIQEFKNANPAYKDVPDLELADALHQKFYSEIPKSEFLSQVGVSDPNSGGRAGRGSVNPPVVSEAQPVRDETGAAFGIYPSAMGSKRGLVQEQKKSSVLEGIQMPEQEISPEVRANTERLVEQGKKRQAETQALISGENRSPRSGTDYLKDLGLSVAKITPSVAKNLVDIGNLLTAGQTPLGDASKYLSEAMSRVEHKYGSKAANEERRAFAALMSSDAGAGDVAKFIASNPLLAADMGITSAGSMAVPVGAAGLAAKVFGKLAPSTATGVANAANALMNAGDTFTQTEGDAGQKMLAAGVAGAGSLAAGKLTGGGLEGQIARQSLSGNVGLSGARTVLGEVGKEAAQEYGENASQSIGQDVGQYQTPDLAKANREGLVGAMIAPVMAGPVSARNAAVNARQEVPLDQALSYALETGQTVKPLPASAPAASPTPTAAAAIDAIGSAQSVDEAISAAQAAVSAPSGGMDIAARIAELEGARAAQVQVPEVPAQSAPVQDVVPEATEPAASVIPPAYDPRTQVLQNAVQPQAQEAVQPEPEPQPVAPPAVEANTYQPAIPQPGLPERIVQTAKQEAEKFSDLADPQMYPDRVLESIAGRADAGMQLRNAAQAELNRRQTLEAARQQRLDEQFAQARSGTPLEIPNERGPRPLSVERGMEIIQAGKDRALLPQERGYLDALKEEIGTRDFDLIRRTVLQPFLVPMSARKFEVAPLIERNRQAIAQWDGPTPRLEAPNVQNQPARIGAQAKAPAAQAPKAARSNAAVPTQGLATTGAAPVAPVGLKKPKNQKMVPLSKRGKDADLPDALTGEKPMFSRSAKITPLQDAEYLTAVANGDMESAQRMVNQAAQSAGYVDGTNYRMDHSAPDSKTGTNLVDLRESGLVPDDFWSKPDWYVTTPEERIAHDRIRSLLKSMDARSAAGKNPGLAAITVYRAVPKDIKDSTLRNGDWISPSEAYAQQEGEMIPGGYRIISTTVSARNLWWDGNSIAELGYDDGQSYAYRNTKNNRKLADVITRDDDGNVIPLSKRFNARSDDVRFSRPEAEADPLAALREFRQAKLTAVRKAVNDLTSEWANRPEIVVVNGMQDPAVPQRVREADEAQKSQGAEGEPEGFFYGGKVYLLASEVNTPEDIARVLFHEALGHYGLRGTFGDELKPILKNIADLRPDLMKPKAKQYGLDLQDPDQRLYVAEEVLAELAQTKPEMGIVKRAIAAIRTWLRENLKGFDSLKLSDDEIIRNYILPARGWVERGEAETAADALPAFDRSESGEPASFSRSGGWNAPADTRTDKLIYNLQDGRIDLKRVQEEIAKTGAKLDEQFDARLAETLYAGRVAKRASDFLKIEVKPLLESMAKNGVSMDELSDFLLARHAPERNEQIAKVNPAMSDGGAGSNSKGELMTTQAAKDYLAAMKPTRRELLTMMAKKVDALTAGTRDLLVREGLEKAETVNAWAGAYKHYVPLFKDEAEAGNPHPQGSGFSVKGSSSKRAMGSKKQVTNMLAHVLMQREAALTRAEKNRVGMSLYGLVLSQPNSEFWTAIRPSMSDAEIESSLEAMGVDPSAIAGMERAPTIMTVNKSTGQVQSTPNPMYKNRPNALVLKVNGEDRVILFNEGNERAMRLAENLKNLDGVTSLDLAGSVVGKATRFMASMATQYNPAFGMVNLVRDTGGALVNLTSTPLAGKQAAVLSNVPAAINGIARDLRGGGRTEWSDLYQQFQDDGGQTGYKEMWRTADERAKAIESDLKSLEKAGKLTIGKVAHAVLGLMDDFNTTLENAVRLSAYKEALDQGLSRPVAAKLARELTVDFNRKGRLAREINPLYAFFNASLQGTARHIEALKGPAGKKILIGGLTLGVLQYFMLATAGYDDEDVPEFVKARALIIPMWPFAQKKYIAIPLPLGLHVLPNTGRVLTELMMSKGKNFGSKSWKSLGEIAGAFNPLGGGDVTTAHGLLTTISPTVADPLIDLATNRNFAGNKISKETFDGDHRPGYQLGKETTARMATGRVYEGIAHAVNWVTSGGNDNKRGWASPTPEVVRYLAGTLGGGLYREVEKALNVADAIAHNEPVRADQVPLGSRFYGEVDKAQVNRTKFFENMDRVRDVKAQLKSAEKARDMAGFQAIVKDNPTEVALIKSLDRVTQDLSELNKIAMESVGDRERLKKLDEARDRLMSSANESIKRMEEIQSAAKK